MTEQDEIEVTPELIAAGHLIWVWHQYADIRHVECDPDHVAFDHMCMSAGEGATEWLQSLGLAEDNGWQCILTEKGRKLLEMDIFPDTWEEWLRWKAHKS